jgi:hypothetical protein
MAIAEAARVLAQVDSPHKGGSRGKAKSTSTRKSPKKRVPSEYLAGVGAALASAGSSPNPKEKFRTAKDVRNIQGVNKLYHDLVRELVHRPSPSKNGAAAGAGLVAQSAGQRAALRAAQAVVDPSHSPSSASPPTRIHEKRLRDTAQSRPNEDQDQEHMDFLNLSEEKTQTQGLLETPAGTVWNTHTHVGIHVPSLGSPEVPTTVFQTTSRFSPQQSASGDSSPSAQVPPFSPLTSDLEREVGGQMDQLALLEARFHALDAQYHSILSGGDNSPAQSADQLVDVIRQLHETGQQLRDLRSSPQKQP